MFFQITHPSDNIKHSLNLDEKISVQITSVIEKINQDLISLGQVKSILMGSTSASGMVIDDTLYFAHVGDSRLYLFRDGLLAQLTKDDTLKQQMEDIAAEQSRFKATDVLENVPKNIVTQAIGLTPSLIVHCGKCSLKYGDVIMCSTDGLHDVFEHTELEMQLRGIAKVNNKSELEVLTKQLVDLAITKGSKDNVSVLLLKSHLSLTQRMKSNLHRFLLSL